MNKFKYSPDMISLNYKNISKACFVLLLLLAIGCKNDQPKVLPTKVNHATLIIANEGSIYNYNLDEHKIAWQYNSKLDTAGNRNYFAVDGENIFLPFESGKLINLNVNTGKVIWQHQIFGDEGEVQAMSSDIHQQEEMLMARMPLFMATPFVDGDKIIIASTGQPMQTRGWLYCFNRANGVKKWSSELPTIFNFYAPVKYCGNYFYNSAVFLRMFTPESGTYTSYGMFDDEPEVAGEPLQNHEVSQFDRPIYNQMQTDGKNIFIGDEHGKFYCLQLNSRTASVDDGDITDPNNTFIKNPKVFKWIFGDSTFSFQKNHLSFLNDDILYAEMKTGMADTSCLFAIDTDNGKPKWKKVIKGDVLNWAFGNEKIIGHTEKIIFWIDASGQNYSEIKTENKPLSNIEWIDKTHFIYLTQKGIQTFDVSTKTTKLIFTMPMRVNDYNNLQIKYFPK